MVNKKSLLNTIYSTRSHDEEKSDGVSPNQQSFMGGDMVTFETKTEKTRNNSKQSSKYQIKQIVKQTKEYEKMMLNRVQYLMKEEKKVFKRIDNSLQKASREEHIKEFKYGELERMIKYQIDKETELTERREKNKKMSQDM